MINNTNIGKLDKFDKFDRIGFGMSEFGMPGMFGKQLIGNSYLVNSYSFVHCLLDYQDYPKHFLALEYGFF